MKLEKIISFANKTSELRFLVMVRSLRDTGCNLPVWVIPYDNNKFDLPDNCIWWEIKEVITLLEDNNIHCMKRKFQCFFTSNYQYVDADIIFLTNPEHALANLTGFITSCCHWNNPYYTYIQSTFELFRNKSTTWQKSIFNSGQFACDIELYDLNTLDEVIKNPLHHEALSEHDQISINLFVFLSGVKITNTTLPPYNIESTWAGDYLYDNYSDYWINKDKKPYIIHWAGCKMDIGRPIDQLFLNYLTDVERQEWEKKLIEARKQKVQNRFHRMFSFFKRF